jgi:hypothetical protein
VAHQPSLAVLVTFDFWFLASFGFGFFGFWHRSSFLFAENPPCGENISFAPFHSI